MKIEVSVHAHGSHTPLTLDLSQKDHCDTLRKILSDAGGRTRHIGGIDHYVIVTEQCMFVFDRAIVNIMARVGTAGGVPQAIVEALEKAPKLPTVARSEPEAPTMIEVPKPAGGQRVEVAWVAPVTITETEFQAAERIAQATIDRKGTGNKAPGKAPKA